MIEIDKLSEEDFVVLKQHFLDNHLILIKDILQPIEEYFWKFDFNVESQHYELYLGVPKDWLHDMIIAGYKIELVNESESGKIIKLVTTSEDMIGDLDEMVQFGEDIIQRNTAILAKIREKELQLQTMKDQMVEVRMALDREIEILKTIKNGEQVETEDKEESIPVIPEPEKSVVPVQEIVSKPKKEKTISKIASEDYVAPTSLSKEEAEKFVELITNGKK